MAPLVIKLRWLEGTDVEGGVKASSSLPPRPLGGCGGGEFEFGDDTEAAAAAVDVVSKTKWRISSSFLANSCSNA